MFNQEEGYTFHHNNGMSGTGYISLAAAEQDLLDYDKTTAMDLEGSFVGYQSIAPEVWKIVKEY